MKAYGLLGLAVVLFAVLVLAPYLRSFTEGYTNAAEAVQEKSNAQAEEVKKLGQELVTLNKLLENPTLDQSTREKVIKQKDEVQAQVEKLTKVSLPDDQIKPKEGFTASNASDLNKKKATEAFETFR